jgi:hypothetical protein
MHRLGKCLTKLVVGNSEVVFIVRNINRYVIGIKHGRDKHIIHAKSRIKFNYQYRGPI